MSACADDRVVIGATRLAAFGGMGWRDWLGGTCELRLCAVRRAVCALIGALRAALCCNRSRCSLAGEAGIKHVRRVATPGSHHPSLITHHPLENAAKKILAKKFEKS